MITQETQIQVGNWYKTRDGRTLQCVGTRLDIQSIPFFKQTTYYLFPLSGAGNYAVQEDGTIFLDDTNDDIVEMTCRLKHIRS